MDLQAIFADELVANRRPILEPPQDDPGEPDRALSAGWPEWTEERDGQTWRVIQRDGVVVVPWEECIPWHGAATG